MLLLAVGVVVVWAVEHLVILNAPVVGVMRSLVVVLGRDNTLADCDFSVPVDILDISVKVFRLALFGETQTSSPIGEVRIVVGGTVLMSGCHCVGVVGGSVVYSKDRWEVGVFWNILWLRRR